MRSGENLAAARLAPRLLQRTGFTERFARHGFRAEVLTPAYGLAECSVGLTLPPLGRGPRIDRIRRDRFEREGRAEAASASDPDALEIVSCGRPLPGHEVRFLDELGREVGEREVGRLEFKGPSATRGYFQNPQATAKLIHAPWVDSGDYGYAAEGEVYLTGRAKDLVIRGGRKIYPRRRPRPDPRALRRAGARRALKGDGGRAGMERREPPMASSRASTGEPISACMSRKFVSVSPTATAGEALVRASESSCEHLLVFDSEQLVGVVCRCDLDRARPDVPVGGLLRKRLVTVNASATQGTAAELMRTQAVGCLPVLSGGLILGVVTRSDLLRAGVPRDELGGPCAACGSQHGLRPERLADDVPFCRDCLECRGSGNELGGGD